MKSRRANSPEHENQDWLVKFLLVVFMIGFHTRISIYSGGAIIVPMYLCLFSGAGIFVLALQRGLGRLLAPLLGVVGLIVLTAFSAGAFGGDIVALVRGALQLSASIVIAAGLAVVLGGESMRGEDRFFLVLWAVFLVVACVELIPAVRPVFDRVSSALYAGSARGLYASLDRDLQLYGQYRPKAFASEPSFLAATLSTLNLLVLFTGMHRGRRRALARYFVMLVIAYLVAPSLSALFYLTAAMVFVFWPRTAGLKAMAVGALLLAVGALAAFPLTSVNVLSAHQRSGSFFGRITAGPFVGVQSLIERPLLGYGVGDSQAVFPTVSRVWSEQSAYSAFPWYGGLGSTELMSNGFWWQWIYFGVVGGILFVMTLFGVLRAMGVLRPLSILVSVWIVWYAGAAFVDIVSWTAFAVFASAGIAQRPGRQDVAR
jgi:hypothetical protein